MTTPHIHVSSRRGRFGLVLHLLLLLALTKYYFFQCTAGTYGPLRSTIFYNDLAEAFRQGHTYLPAPNPALLAKANPYDPVHQKLWRWDALLWNGRYYMHWGPVPAVVLLVFKVLTSYEQVVPDQWLTLAFMLGRLYAGAALILTITSVATRRVPIWASLLATLVFALASPTPFIMARPWVYETSVAAGQFFMLTGLTAAFWAVRRRSWLLATVAGTSWALALNARSPWFVVAPILALICAYVVHRRSPQPNFNSALRAFCAFGLPVVISIELMGIYNYVRFGSFTNFGLNYQLTGRVFVPSTKFVVPNIVSYLFGGMEWSCNFPFVQVSTHRSLPAFIDWPVDYDIGNAPLAERVSGLFVTAPICLLAGALVARAAVQLWRKRRELGTELLAASTSPETCLVVCLACCLLSMLPALTMFTASMRYLEDSSGAVLLIAVLAGFKLLGAWPRVHGQLVHRVGAGLVVLVATYTIVVGVCLGFTGLANNFIADNPAMHAHLVQQLSVCRNVSRPLEPSAKR